MYKLYDWLAEKVTSHFDGGTTLIDVGAYHGDFAHTLFSTKKFTHALMFEPNPKHYLYLQNRFSTQKDFFLYPYALGNEHGSSQFNCSQDDATGSVLQYHPKYHHESTEKQVSSFTVEITRLDDFYEKHFPHKKVGLIKIDTQGFDLEVLKGAEQLIRKYRPWLVIELNFLPFYTAQAPIDSLFSWLAKCGYNLGGFFNDHYSKDQWLAFADGVFIPENTVTKIIEPYSSGLANLELLEQNQYLQNVCAERLELIERLHDQLNQKPPKKIWSKLSSIFNFS